MSGQSDGLRYAFNQNHDLDSDPKPAKDKKRVDDKAFTARSPDGNLYNTENDKPIKDTAMVETGSNRTVVDEHRAKMIKLGDEVNYRDKKGVVIAKEDMFVTIQHEDIMEKVHVGETYFDGDLINNQLWDRMAIEQRQSLLFKSGIPIKPYVERNWFSLPEQVRDIIKDSPPYTEPSHGGFAGREEGITRDDESRSFRDVTQPEHVTRPYKDERDKSDVESGVYGGVRTETPFDATEDYEEDHNRAKKPLSGAQDESNKKRCELASKDGDTAITGKPSKEDKEKEAEGSAGAAVVGSHKEKEGPTTGGTMTTTAEGAVNPIHNRQREISHKHNTRWGPRYSVTKAEFDETQK